MINIDFLRVKVVYRILGIEFNSKVHFFKTLGYNKVISDAQVTKQYKGMENLLKIRSKLNDLDQIKSWLQNKKDAYDLQNSEMQHSCIVDTTILDLLKLCALKLSSDDLHDVLYTYSLIKHVNVDVLEASLKSFLRNDNNQD